MVVCPKRRDQDALLEKPLVELLERGERPEIATRLVNHLEGLFEAPAMMGPKTLKTIREELKAALGATGEDPIQWLETRIQQLEKERKPVSNETEVLQALLHVLERELAAKPRSTHRQTRPSRRGRNTARPRPCPTLQGRGKIPPFLLPLLKSRGPRWADGSQLWTTVPSAGRSAFMAKTSMWMVRAGEGGYLFEGNALRKLRHGWQGPHSVDTVILARRLRAGCGVRRYT